ncbi:AMP binding protein [Mycena amicta]|nr:AMP binding protein [Mycena amicta]
MPPRIYASSYPSLRIPRTSVFSFLFASHGHSGADSDIGGFPRTRPAFIDAATGVCLTRGQLVDLALALANGLRTRLGLRRGDTVLLYSPNSLAWPVLLFGCVAAGLRITTANSAYTSRELAHQYTDSGASIVITTDEGVGTVRDMFNAELGIRDGDARIVVTVPGDLRWAGGPEPAAGMHPSAVGLLRMEDLLLSGRQAEEERFDGPLSDETAFLCYSSGTTGKPKGVETTHYNAISLLTIVRQSFHRSQSEDVMLAILPFYHVYALIQVVQLPLVDGLPVVIQTRFEPTEYCANIEKYRVTVSLIVPPVLVVLARHPAAEAHDLSSLKYVCSGAAPLGKELVDQVLQRLSKQRKAGGGSESTLTITQGYGMTEMSPTTHLLPIPDAVRKMGSVGTLLPNLRARLVASSSSSSSESEIIDAEEGEPGELWLHGPTVMKGYLNNPRATKESLTPDGWYKTGDIAVRDKEGYYYIVDRSKELIKYKGFQVPPAELESVLLTHPEIADAAVIGINDIAQATELPRAYIVPAHPEHLLTASSKTVFAQRVAKWMESQVARHKFLRGGVVLVDEIPKSAAGKILRRELRELAKKEQQQPQQLQMSAKL